MQKQSEFLANLYLGMEIATKGTNKKMIGGIDRSIQFSPLKHGTTYVSMALHVSMANQ